MFYVKLYSSVLLLEKERPFLQKFARYLKIVRSKHRESSKSSVVTRGNLPLTVVNFNFSFCSPFFRSIKYRSFLCYYREHFKIVDGSGTAKYDKSGFLQITDEHMVEVPFLSSAEIEVNISLVQQGSSVKAQFLVLSSALLSGKHH